MNYITEINAFEDWCERNYLPILAQYLWYKLMSKNNKLGWCEWVQVDNLDLMGILKIKREATAIEIRDKLIEAGLVEFEKGKKGKPNQYKMVSLSDLKVKTVVKSVTQTEVNSVVNPVVQTATSHNNKTKTKTETKTNDSSEPKNVSLPAADIFITFPLNDGTGYGVTLDKIKQYAKLYPAVDVEQSLRDITGWCLSNPEKRKTRRGAESFINRWLAKEQNRGGTKNGGNGGYTGGGNTKQPGGETGITPKKTSYGDCV